MHSLSDETSIVQTECCSCVAYKESCKDAEQAHQARGRHASPSSCNSFRARLIPSRQQVATPYTFVPSGHQSVNEKYYTMSIRTAIVAWTTPPPQREPKPASQATQGSNDLPNETADWNAGDNHLHRALHPAHSLPHDREAK